MKKTLLIIALALLAVAGYSLSVSLNSAGNHVSCSPAAEGMIRLEIRIGEFIMEGCGGVKLPQAFAPSLAFNSHSPALSFLVAVANSGEYTSRISDHRINTGSFGRITAAPQRQASRSASHTGSLNLKTLSRSERIITFLLTISRAPDTAKNIKTTEVSRAWNTNT